MLFDFKYANRPNKIKSLKELEPDFMPRWFKYCFRAVLLIFAFLALIAVAQFFEAEFLAIVGAMGIVLCFTLFFLVILVPPVLSIVGYYWPWLALKAAQLDSWLERDLEWGPRK